MRTPIMLAGAALLALPLAACDDGYGYGDRPGYASGRGGYYLSENDSVYRDNDGRYYCRRRDGSTGTIVGGLAGALVGNAIAPGGSKTIGTLLGAAGGAVAGNAIDRKNMRCR